MIATFSMSAIAGTVVLHWLSGRIFPSAGAILRFSIIFIVAFPIVVWISSLVFDARMSRVAAAAWYFFACELYVFCFTLSLGSVSVKLLYILRAGPRSRRDLEEAYSPAGMVDIRLHRLVAAGFMMPGEEIKVTKKGAMIARVALVLRNLLHSTQKNSFRQTLPS